MKIIDICDNYVGGGCLKHYYVKNKITNYKIICMGLNLAVGDIKNNHKSLLRTLYEDNMLIRIENYTLFIEQIINLICFFVFYFFIC